MSLEWENFDDAPPKSVGVYEWRHIHPLGFVQAFFAKMRMRGAGVRDVLSPEFDYWDGYRVIVPKGFKWRVPKDLEKAQKAAKNGVVIIDGLDLRACPFCGAEPTISASQWGNPGGGDGIVINPAPQNYNTWRVERCCHLVGFNGFKSPHDLSHAWNGHGDTA